MSENGGRIYENLFPAKKDEHGRFVRTSAYDTSKTGCATTSADPCIIRVGHPRPEMSEEKKERLMKMSEEFFKEYFNR